MRKFVILAIVGLLASCKASVNPNEWVVSTTTCWNTLSVLKAGSPIPRLVTACDRVVILPATELAGDIIVETKFGGKSRVAGKLNMTYQWRITDPQTFIASAKSITSSPTSQDHKIDPNALEGIENSVVDKMLADIIREYTPTIEPSDVDELKMEKEIEMLAKSKIHRCIEFSGISLNVDFSPQTEEALDVMSALKFYESNGQLELGKEIIKQKAGATKVIIQQAADK